MAAGLDPWPTATPIDTTVPVAASLQQALAAIREAALVGCRL